MHTMDGMYGKVHGHITVNLSLIILKDQIIATCGEQSSRIALSKADTGEVLTFLEVC